MDIENLIKTILECAYQVRTRLAAGFLESIYREALLLELREKGIMAEKECAIKVYYREVVVGEFKADLCVENRVIIELKAVRQLSMIHEAQLVNYLTATHIDHGLLINFGGERLEIKRKYRTYRKRSVPD